MDPLLEMWGIYKGFPGVQALQNAGLDLYEGEVLGLVGENGAGKSTLVRILGGAIQPDAGEVKVMGKPVHISSPQEAQRNGISIIYQEFNLIPNLTVHENIFLGREPAKFGFISKKTERRKSFDLMTRLGVHIDVDTLCRDLSIAHQQIVEIGKALSVDSKIIVMDEPSATLTTQEVEKLFAIIRELKNRRLAVIYISHRLNEILEIADRVIIMRDGKTVENKPVTDLSQNVIIEKMVGRSLENEYPKEKHPVGNTILSIQNFNRLPKVKNVSFHVCKGEVLGITGLVGAGRTELARLIFGADKKESGSIKFDGKDIDIQSPIDAIKHGICLLTEDRKVQGLILDHSVRENFGLPNLRRYSKYSFINKRSEKTAFDRYVKDLKIKLSDREMLVKYLSGGNQQKVVLAKWLESDSNVVIFDEPTRGIDVGTKYEIYLLINRLAADGKAVIMISSELPEIIGMSDRIIVMREGRISGEIHDVAGITPEEIMRYAVGTQEEIAGL
jgi:ribose transport system ATP-binding protein